VAREPDLVECYSGGEYAERPRALHWQGLRLEVSEVLRSWRSLEGVRFLVRAADDRVFELGYAIETDAWSILEK
jgi:hypothetical protein